MRSVSGSPFAIDWLDKDAVIAYAKKFGKGMTVSKSPDRDNYNITHTVNEHLYRGDTVVFQT